jgi:hypothetical protein
MPIGNPHAVRHLPAPRGCLTPPVPQRLGCGYRPAKAAAGVSRGPAQGRRGGNENFSGRDREAALS